MANLHLRPLLQVTVSDLDSSSGSDGRLAKLSILNRSNSAGFGAELPPEDDTDDMGETVAGQHRSGGRRRSGGVRAIVEDGHAGRSAGVVS